MGRFNPGRHWRMWVAATLALGLMATTPAAGPQQGLERITRLAGMRPSPDVMTQDVPFPVAKPDRAAVESARHESVSGLMQKAIGGRLVRVIVGFDAGFIPEGRMTSAGVASQRQDFAEAASTILDQMLRGSAAAVKRFETIPYFAAEVSAEALQRLHDLPQVTSIVEDVPDQLFLSDSTTIVQANQVWAAGVTGQGWNVAILDTGVDKTHPMFGGGKIASEACFSTNTSDSVNVCPGGANSTATGSGVNCPAGYAGYDHGTHVAGIAAGNSGSLKGVAPGANVIAVQVFSGFSASYCGGSPCALSYSSDQILGLEYVLALSNAGAKIASVNMSLGGGKYTSRSACDADNGPRKAAIDNLRSRGIATVIATGNNGYSDGISAPGCISSAISVGSTTKSGSVASYSNMAQGMVDVVAPGSSILSAIPGGGYALKSGTSMATPTVAGGFALLARVMELKGTPGTVSQFVAVWNQTGLWRPDSGSAGSGGTYPEIRAYDAAMLLYTGGGGSAPGTPSALTNTVSGSNITLNWSAPTTGGAPTAYTIQAGSTPGLANLANFSTGNTATRFSSGGIGDGLYYLRVYATNGAGTSGPSNESTMRVGCTGAPGAPSGLLITQNSGGNVAFRWTAASGEPSSYIIEAGSAPGLANMVNVDLGSTTAFAAGGVGAGTYYVRVRARNACGTSGASDEVILTVASPVPGPAF